MTDELVTVSPALLHFLSHFEAQVERFEDELQEELRPVVRERYESSIIRRWYESGDTLRSLQERSEVQRRRTIFRIGPVTRYAKFGEWGTGERGSATGRPAPLGWKYGALRGIAARRYTRLAVEEMRPEIERRAAQRAAAFAKNLTVN